MRAFVLTLAALAGVLFAGTSTFAAHGHGGYGGFGGGGHYHGGWHGGGGWHGAYRGGYSGYGGWNRGHYAGNWNRGYYGGWNRPYYTGYRGFYGNSLYGYGYRNYGYRYGWGYPGYVGYRNYYPSFYRTYYSTPFYGGYGYPVYNSYYYPSFGYGCYGYDNAFGSPTFVYGATSLPPTYATSELPYGFDGVRPFVDSLQVNHTAPTTTAASILRNLAANRPTTSVLTRFSGDSVAVAPPKADPPAFSPSVSPPPARQRARDMIAIGDRYFREQKYYDASRKYREAAETAPDLAEAHFRSGHALTAMNRYDQAVASFRKALALRSDANRDGFKLGDLYGEAHTAKTSHTEALAAAAIEDPNRADHLLLLGMLLHYDGHADLAEKCFKRSAELDRNLKLSAYVSENEI